MYDANVVNTKVFAGNKTAEEAFNRFKIECGMLDERCPFTYTSEQTFDGKPIKWTVKSWGSYFTSDGKHTVFVCYRAPRIKEARQISWTWDGKAVIPTSRRVHFIEP